MALQTDLCRLLGITHPVVQAGMAREYTSARLVAAVSDAGGLGILGCLGRSADETVAEVRRIRALTDRPFAVNHVLHRLDEAAFDACLAEGVSVMACFRGDPAWAVARARSAGAVMICQVTTTAEAVSAVAVGADVLIAQGTEAGGHMGPMPLWTLLPEVLAVAEGRPVLAAGGIVDGRGLAAALCLGAAGVVMGTRFLATPEAPVSDLYKRLLLRAGPDATIASDVPDILWGPTWPGVQARALRNQLLVRWHGRAGDLRAARDEALARLAQAEAADDPEETIVLAGMGVSRISEIRPAGEIVRAVVTEAATILRAWGQQADDGGAVD